MSERSTSELRPAPFPAVNTLVDYINQKEHMGVVLFTNYSAVSI